MSAAWFEGTPTAGDLVVAFAPTEYTSGLTVLNTFISAGATDPVLRICNITGGSIDPPALPWRVVVYAF